MIQLEMSLDGKELLVERPMSVRHDVYTSLPSLFAVSIDGLAGSDSVAREVLCKTKKEI